MKNDKTISSHKVASRVNLNFHPFEVVSRYRDPQLQVGEKFVLAWTSEPHPLMPVVEVSRGLAVIWGVSYTAGLWYPPLPRPRLNAVPVCVVVNATTAQLKHNIT